ADRAPGRTGDHRRTDGRVDGNGQLRDRVHGERAGAQRVRGRGLPRVKGPEGPARRATTLMRTVLVGMGAAAAAGALGCAGTRRLIRKARTRPDPERGEDLAERPGTLRTVVSFDGTKLAVNVVGPDDGPALVMAHGF